MKVFKIVHIMLKNNTNGLSYVSHLQNQYWGGGED